jgi:hypothetical protein
MTEEQIPEGFRLVKIKPEIPKTPDEASWTHLPEAEVRQVAVGARAAIIEWLNNPAKVLYWHGDGEGSISESPIISPIIAHLKETYPEQSRRIQENPHLGVMELVIVDTPGLALILTMGGGSSK